MPDAPPIDPSQAQLQLHASVPFGFPVRGINQNWGREQQPPGSTPDCLNVMPYDLTLRARGGQRPGIVTATNNTAYARSGSAGGVIPTMVQALVSVAVENSGGSRANYLIAIIGANVFTGTGAFAALTVATAGTTFSALPRLTPACIGSKVYWGDGAKLVSLDLLTNATAAHAYGPSTLGPKITCAWRRRLVCSQTADGNPQNIYMSRVNDPTDFDYGKEDPAAAFAINNSSKSGQVGDPVTALMPLSEDLMIAGCDRSLWAVEGDPQDGGRVVLVNAGVGVLGSRAWCVSPDGDLYFAGTGGLYRMRRGSLMVENLSSNRYNSFFYGINTAGYDWSMLWDRERHGCYVFRTQLARSGPPTDTHLWWDARGEGLFPLQIPAIMGPVSCCGFDTQTLGSEGRILMGGYATSTGGLGTLKLYTFKDTALTDDSTAISSYAFLGPVRPAGDALRRSRLTSLDLILGEAPSGLANSDMSVTWTLQSANTAVGALATPVQTASATITSAVGRQATIRARQTASDFFLKLATGGSGKTWSIDEAIARFVRAGRVRT